MGKNMNYNIESTQYTPTIPNYNSLYTTVQHSPPLHDFQHNFEPAITNDHVCLDNDVRNLSGKIESFSLSDAIKASITWQVPAEEQRSHCKRSSKTARLESGSNIVPREIARLQVSNSIDTPNNSGHIVTSCDNSAKMASFLTKCGQINDL